MSKETRIIRSISNEPGTLTPDSGAPAQVWFNLVVTQEFIDGTPGFREGSGTIQFIDPRLAEEFFLSSHHAALRSESVQVRIMLITIERFLTVGPIRWDDALSAER